MPIASRCGRGRKEKRSQDTGVRRQEKSFPGLGGGSYLLNPVSCLLPSRSRCQPLGRPPARFFEDWHDRNWGEITEQDYENLANVQRGMRSSGWEGARLNPRQESNILHMHRTIDTYLLGPSA